MPHQQIERVVHATLDAGDGAAVLEEVHRLLATLWPADAGVGTSDRIRFETSVIEITGNIVEHAVAGADRARVGIHLLVTCTPERLSAELTDDAGRADIDLDAVHMPDWSVERGRGLAMAMSMTDELRYQRLPDGNRWSLTCLRTTSD